MVAVDGESRSSGERSGLGDRETRGMSSRRKRGANEGAAAPPTPLSSKRRRNTPNNNNMERTLEQLRQCQELLESMKHVKTEDNRVLCDSFMKNPSKRSDPEYYKVVKNPMDMARLQQKLRTEEYTDVEEFYSDFQLMIDNTLEYYKPASQEYTDAMELKRVFEERREVLEAGGEVKKPNGEAKKKETCPPSASPSLSSRNSVRSPSPSGSAATASSSDTIEAPQVEDILCTILELTDESKRLISPPFRLLQTPDEFPSYYQKIKSPIDLKTIAEKTRAGCYMQISQLEQDFKLLCKNAKVFNEPGSLIHKDANTILSIFMKKKSEIGKNISTKRVEHCRQVVDSLIAQSSTEDNDTYSEDSEEDEEMESSEDPQWQLYWAVRNASSSANDNESLSDPFLELPSKHYYPDYFDEVAQPMSFFMINAKLKRGEYASLSQLVDHFMLVFANACEYNMDGSDIHVAAVKLRELCLSKAWQLNPQIDINKYLKSSSPTSSAKEGKEAATTANQGKPKNAMGAMRKIKEEPREECDGIVAADPNSTPSSPAPKKRWRRARPISTGITPLPPPTGKPGRKSMDELMLRFRVKLISFWDIIHEYRENEYWPAGAFMNLPSKEDYPSYYEVITNPIDMATIREKIEMNGYKSSTELMADFSTLFSNARQYNEPDSDLYSDAEKLQKLVEERHATTKGTPFESPLHLKEKFGWLKTSGRARPSQPPFLTPNGTAVPSDDDSICSTSIRSPPAPSGCSTPAVASAPSTAHSTPKTEKKAPKDRADSLTEEQKRMNSLLHYIKEYRDDKKRKIAQAFVKLPSKQEYPNYYEVIKKPIDLHRIQQKLNSQGYGNYSELIADLRLMFDNACKYNEPESQIYKDAIQLQRVLLEKKRELVSDSESVLSVQVEIRALFTSVFVTVFNKKDSEGRCYSDGLADIHDLLKAKGVSEAELPFSLDTIKRNIDRSRYRRLDRLQQDFFALFEKARQVSRSDSQLFDDSANLQLAFVDAREEVCKGVMISSAFHINRKDVEEQITEERKKKATEESDSEKGEEKEEKPKEGEVDLEEVTVEGVIYRPSEYALVAPSEREVKQTHVMRVERIYRDETGSTLVKGRWFYRPHETFHLATKKFLENEVFLTNFYDTITLERLVGRCCVLFMKNYVRSKPKGMEEKDLLACEEFYLGNKLHFRKIKQWPFEESVEMEEREEVLTPVRKARPFIDNKKGVQNGDAADSEDEEASVSSLVSTDDESSSEEPFVLDIERLEIEVREGDAEEEDADGRCYYQQMLSRGERHFALGNDVLVFNPRRADCDVMRIDRLWREKDGSECFSGGWFARPSDVTHEPAHSFYKRELLAVVQADQTRRVEDIQSKCAVLPPKQFMKERPTEVPECDVFVCERRVSGPCSSSPPNECSLFHSRITLDPSTPSMHIDGAKHAPKFKSYSLAVQIAHEELFIFKTPITMEKEMSPMLTKTEDAELVEMVEETTEADNTESVGAKELVSWLAHQPKLTAKSKSGYILFSAEIRKRIMHENPEAGFGEVSKIVGVEWKKLSEEQKKQYEVRAEYIANERAKQEAANIANNKTIQPGQIRVYICKWHNCDYQFDSAEGLCEHLIHFHTSQIIVDSENQYVCMWLTCLRNRKDGKPFPSLPRLHRHIKEKHLASSFKIIYGNQRAKNFFKYIVSGAENGTPQTGQLVHFPYGMHPSQVAAGGPVAAAALATPPAGQPQPVNGHPPSSALHNGQHTPQHENAVASRVNGFPQPTQQMAQPPSGQHYSMAGPAHAAGPSSAGMTGPAPLPAGPLPDARSIVTLSRPIEPVFIPPPSSIHARRVLHSETYLRYIESLGNHRQRTVSIFDRSLRAHPRNTQPNPSRSMPANWLRESRGGQPVREEEVTRALWRLREELLQSTLGVERDYSSLL